MVISGSNGNVSVNSTVTNTFTKLDVYNSTEDAHFFASGASPSLVLSQVDGLEAFTSTNPFAKLGLATRTSAFGSHTVPGDLVLINYNNNAIVFSTGGRSSIQNNTSNEEKMRINGNGNVGIGTNTPTAVLHTNGTVRFQNIGTGSYTNYLVMDANGNLRVGPAVSGTSTTTTSFTSNTKNFDQEVA